MATRQEKIDALIDDFKKKNPDSNLLLFKIFLSQKSDEQLDDLLVSEAERMNDFAYSN